MNLHKDPSSWVKVSPKFALQGSAAQAENVLQMALDDIGRLDAEIVRLRAALFKIQTEQLRVATSTDMTRNAMRDGAMETRNEIVEILKPV